MSSEKTSARVTRIAAKVMNCPRARPPKYLVLYQTGRIRNGRDETKTITWADVKALAASALTQAADKPKRKRRRW